MATNWDAVGGVLSIGGTITNMIGAQSAADTQIAIQNQVLENKSNLTTDGLSSLRFKTNSCTTSHSSSC